MNNMQEIRSIKHKYYTINTMYMSSLALFSAIFYVYLKGKGFSFVEINLFNIFFWGVNFLTEIPAGAFVDQYGKKKGLEISIALRIIGLLLIVVSNNVPLMLLGAVVTSIAESFKSGTLEAWAIQMIGTIDKQYDSIQLFTLDKILLNSTGMIFSFVGTQLIGQIDLRYPFLGAIFILLITEVVVRLSMKESTNILSEQAKISNIHYTMKTVLQESVKGLKSVYQDKKMMRVFLSLLPLQFILTGPATQWQIFFQEGKSMMITGYISIAISMIALSAHVVTGKIATKVKKNQFLIATTVVNAIMVIITAIYQGSLIAFIPFAFHVFAMASEELCRVTYLHNELETNNRATIISVFYTVESAFTMVAFLLSGVLTDFLGMKYAWCVLAIFNVVFAIPLLLRKKKMKEDHYFAQTA